VTVAILPAGRRWPDRVADDAQALAEWAQWLRDRLAPRWRTGEWDGDLLLFVGDPSNPRTSVGVCAVAGCGVPIQALSTGYCTPCHTAHTRSGMTGEEFEAVHQREFRRGHVTRGSATCAVPVCDRNAYSQDLCVNHYRSWVKARKRPGIDKMSWMAALKPLAAVQQCRVLACTRERVNINGLCQTHHNKWRQWARQADVGEIDETAVARWAERQPPYLAVHVFSLAPLSPVARWEMLYALQQRDARGQSLSPPAVRGTVARLSDLPSIALAGDTYPDCRWSRQGPTGMGEGTRALLRGVHWEITSAFEQYRGVDPTRQRVWDLRTVSQVLPSLKKGVSPLRNPSSLDFGEVRQGWLREVLMHWARTANPNSQSLRRWHAACVIASRALESRPDGGVDPGKLRFSDVTAVVEGFKRAVKKNGELYSSSFQGHLLVNFFDLLEFGRREGVLDGLSPRFVRHPGHHTIKVVEENEEEIGKAIPESVIRQLDQHIHLLGNGFPYGELPPEAVNAMFRTAYVILRDAGRRPAEVAGLDVDCLEFDHGEYQLVWHNMKGRRRRRRLPIHQETADVVKDWQHTRAGLALPDNSAAHLFPAITNRYRHLDSGNLSRCIRSWADSIPVLDSEELGPDGTPLPFDRSRIFPYAFRHTFCQRYADAGVPLHVLQSLMDHRSANTTSAYYQVSKKMKREAVDTLRVHAMDRHGGSAPMASAVAYEVRSVAVPWGNCVEPSNVKAGGQACPIRFQCSGCSSYRPDPSHLPAIEDQVRSLKANLEMARAMSAADYTIRGLEGEIADYQNVITKMKAKLESMSDAERHEIQEASKVLRRLRASTVSGTVALPMPVIRPAEETGQ
jgi:integrase